MNSCCSTFDGVLETVTTILSLSKGIAFPWCSLRGIIVIVSTPVILVHRGWDMQFFRDMAMVI